MSEEKNNHCRIRFICSNYSIRFACKFFDCKVDDGNCKREFMGECTYPEAQKEAMKERTK